MSKCKHRNGHHFDGITDVCNDCNMRIPPMFFEIREMKEKRKKRQVRKLNGWMYLCGYAPIEWEERITGQGPVNVPVANYMFRRKKSDLPQTCPCGECCEPQKVSILAQKGWK